MKVKRITVSNLKAVSELTVDFKGCTAIITGGNRKGKSSFLRSLPDRVRGNKPDIIVKKGEKEGFAEWELTDGSKFLWKFDTKTKKGETLTFITADDIKTSVTKEIAARYFPPSFDIDQFLNSTPKKQSATLQAILGLDFTQINARYQAAYDDRTQCNAIAKSEAGKVEPIDVKLPDTTSDSSQLMDQMDMTNRINQQISSVNNQVIRNESERSNLLGQMMTLKDKLLKLKESIESDKKWLEDNKAVDVSAVRAEYDEANELNVKIASNNRMKQQKVTADTAQQKAETADVCVKDIETERATMIKEAKLPDGFEFDTDGILYHDLPLTKEQQSSSDLYIAALKLASMNVGEVRTLHFDASTLDKENLAAIGAWAESNDLQLFIERPDYDGGEIKYVLINED